MTFKLLLASVIAFVVVFNSHVHGQSPTSAARRFNIFVKGDATLTSSETEGPIAVGGNATTNQYQVSFNPQHGAFFTGNASIGLAVRGGVKLNSGSLTINNNNYLKIGQCTPSSAAATNLKVWYRDNNNAASTIRITATNKQYSDTPNITINANINTWNPSVGETVNPVCENIFGTEPGQIDMDAAFTTLTSRSAQLATLTDNLPIRDQNGNIMQNAPMGPYLDPSVIGQNPKIIVDPTKLNVLTVSAAVWNSISNSNIERIPSGASIGQTEYTAAFGLVINIINFPAFKNSNGDKIKFPSVGGLSDSQGSYVIYNFPDATETITLGGNTPIHGTIFAPQADLVKDNSGNINGQIIAKSFVHKSDEVHFWPFLPSIPEPVVKKITVVATSKCLNNAPYLDYTVTSNFSTQGLTAKIEWLNSKGDLVQTDNSKPLNGSILFPGAAVSPEGKGIAWPGWKYDGKWIEVSDIYATIRDAGAKIRVTVDPSTTVDITYPLSSTGCSTNPPPPTVLPVSLASFTARNENCNVQLKWTVTAAKDFSRFAVQRSADAKNFKTLDVIKYEAANKEYSYLDAPYSTESVPAKYYYYRLQQIDNDETFEYSTIRSVEAGQCEARFSVDFYPNPSHDEINIKSFSPVKMMEIFTIGGKQVYHAVPPVNQTELKINVQAFTQGLYIVNIVNSEGKFSSKILKR